MNALRAEQTLFSPAPSNADAKPANPVLLQAVDAVFALDDSGRRLDVEISDKPYEALIRFSQELHGFGMSNNLAHEFVEAIEAEAVLLGVDFTQKEKPTPLTMRVRVVDQKPELDESKTHFMVAWDRNGKYGSDFSSVEAHLTNTGTKITTTNVPKFEDLFSGGKKQYLIVHFEKLGGEGVEGLDEVGVELATLVQAVGAAGAASMPEVRQAIEQKTFPAEAQQLVSAVAELKRVVDTSRTPDAVHNPAAKIAELKAAVTQLSNVATKAQVIPPALAEAVKATVKTAEAVVAPAAKNPIKANDSAAPAIVAQAVAADVKQTVQTQAPVSPVAAMIAKIEKEFAQAPVAAAPQTAAKAPAEVQAQATVIQNKTDVKAVPSIVADAVKPAMKVEISSEQKPAAAMKAPEVSVQPAAFKIQETTVQAKPPVANTNTVLAAAPARSMESIAPAAQKLAAAPAPMRAEMAAMPVRSAEMFVMPAPVVQRSSYVEAPRYTQPSTQAAPPSPTPPPSYSVPEAKTLTHTNVVVEEKQKFNPPSPPHNKPLVVPEVVKSAPKPLAPVLVNHQPAPVNTAPKPVNYQPPKLLPVEMRPVNVAPGRKPPTLPEYVPTDRKDFVDRIKAHVGDGAIPKPVQHVIDDVNAGKPISYERMNDAASALGGGKAVVATITGGTKLAESPRDPLPSHKSSVFGNNEIVNRGEISFRKDPQEFRKPEKLEITEEYNTCCGKKCRKGMACSNFNDSSAKRVLDRLAYNNAGPTNRM